MKGLLIFLICLTPGIIGAQDVGNRLGRSYQQFLKDEQLKFALSSLYVIDAATGAPVFASNEDIGLAPASTQKIITAITALDMLGPDFTFRTYLGYDGRLDAGQLAGNLYIIGTGDPTLGSPRWAATKRTAQLARIVELLNKRGINKLTGGIIINDLAAGLNPVPQGWIWQDMGNYYGAGAWGLNWNENQYDLVMKPGAKTGDPVTVIRTDPELPGFRLDSRVTTAAAGTGDNVYIYSGAYATSGFAEGTIPAGVSSFTVAGSNPLPARSFGKELGDALGSNWMSKNKIVSIASQLKQTGSAVNSPSSVFDSILSPSLEKINYWFLRKSVNLYGEAILRQLGRIDDAPADANRSIKAVQQHWKKIGIDPRELNMSDGSGLSPQNRVTTHAQVKLLQYARKQSWYNGFYEGLPEYNGMKMKSGTIGDVKGFCGYHKGKDGKEYIFSFLVNNYNGSSSTLVKKMYDVLDQLK